MKDGNQIKKNRHNDIFKFSVFALLYLNILWMTINTVYLFYPIRMYLAWGAIATIIDIIILFLYCIYIMRLKTITLIAVLISIMIFIPMVVCSIIDWQTYIHYRPYGVHTVID